MAATIPLPDLVRASKLDTQFHRDPEYTQHIRYVSSSTSKPIETQEKWKREGGLHQGGLGIVWLERCIQGGSEGEVRAVKKISKLTSSNDNRELEAIALFSQPKYEMCFVKSFGWYDNIDSLFVTMEYLPSGELYRYLDSALPEKEGRHIVSQILEGLRFMHENGFTHGDLNPDNIIVVSKSPDWWVKIAPFGIGQQRAIEGVAAQRTLTGSSVFTAPEILGSFLLDERSNDSYTNAVDIWSLGVISFLILTGETPFNDHRHLDHYIAGSITFPSDVLFANKISAQGYEFVRSLIAPKSEDRPRVEQCLRYPWIDCLTRGPENQREFNTPISSGYSDAEPSDSWNVQGKILTDEAAISPGVLFDRVSANTIAPTTPELATRINLNPQKAHKSHSDWVNAVAFSPDGSKIASASDDRTIRLWDLATRAPGSILHGHSDCVNALAFSPDGQLLASASWDRTVRLWDPARRARRGTLEGHSGRVSAVAFSPDGHLLASGSWDGTVRLWDPATGAQRGTLESRVNTVSFSPDGQLLASGSWDGAVRLWDPTKGDLRGTLEGHLDRVNAVAFFPDGQLLASASSDMTVRLWDPFRRARRGTLEGHSDRVSAVAFSPDGHLLASGSWDGTVRLWDPATEAQLGTLKGHSHWVNAVAFSPDGQLLASASSDMTVRLWNTATGAFEGTLEGKENVLGVEHPERSNSIDNVASALQYQGNFKAAEETNQGALKTTPSIPEDSTVSDFVETASTASTWSKSSKTSVSTDASASYTLIAALDEITAVFVSDKDLENLFAEAFNKQDREKVSKIGVQLLKWLGRRLVVAANTPVEKEIARFFLSRRRDWAIIDKIAQGVLTESSREEGLEQMEGELRHIKAAKRERLETYLRNQLEVSPVTQTSTNRSTSDHKAPLEEALNDGGSGASTDYEVEENDEQQTVPSNIEAVKLFLKSSDAFARFKEELEDFICPFRSEAMWKMTLWKGRERVRFEHWGNKPRLTNIDKLKLIAEEVLGMPIIWWPLKQPRKRLSPSKVRIIWICECGDETYVDVSCAKARKYRQMCDTSPAKVVAGQSSILPTHNKSLADSTGKRGFRASSSALIGKISNLHQRHTKKESACPVSKGSEQNATSDSNGTSISKYVHWCVDSAPQRTFLHHICIEEKKGMDFFDELCRSYKKLRGWRWYLSMRTCTEIKLVKLSRVYPEEEAVVCTSEGNVLPDLNAQNEYTYYVDPEATDKETHILRSERALIDYYNGRKTCHATDRIEQLIFGIPHRVTSTKLGLKGYGIWARQGFLPARLATFALITQGWAILFMAVWLWYHPGDLQNAFAPGYYSLGLVTVFLAVPDMFPTSMGQCN